MNQWMKRCGFALAIFLILPVSAQTVVCTNPVGYVRFECPGGSDTVVSNPFHGPPRWRGPLAAAPMDVGSGLMRFSLGGDPGFAPNSLTDSPHYVHCAPGSGASGRVLRISAHTADSVDVVATETEAGGLVAGNSVSILPAWTLGTLFPPGTQGTLHVSGSRLLADRGSELLFFDDVTDGKSLAPRRRFFLTAAGWFEAGTYQPAGNTPILPGQPFLIRHRAGSAATTFVAHQQIFGGPVVVRLRRQTAGEQDTMTAPARPVPVKLRELGLGAEVFEVSASTASVDRKDQLLLFDSAEAGVNKLPSITYFRTPTGWVRDGPGFPMADDDLVAPYSGLLIRKAAGSDNTGVTWLNLPNYNGTAP